MDVILLERIEKLGQMGDVVKVKPGFARNYLLPQKKALRATEANKARFTQQRAQLEATNLERRQEAEAISGKVDGLKVVVVRQAGETGQLYGSVSSRDVADALATDGYSVARSQVDLANPIKTVGVHSVALHLHAEVAVNINVNVARSDDEALRQLKGEDLTVQTFDDEAAQEFAAGQAEAGSAAADAGGETE